MRTTLDIDDGVLAAARAIAEAENRSLGSVISELARRALVPAQRTVGEFPTFEVPTDAPAITPDMVDRALDESSMSIALLDVNVLIAAAWPNHVHHAAARRWFEVSSSHGWATTPVTELGFVRISSNKRVIPGAATPGHALGVLRSLCSLPGHEFWPDDARLVDPPFPTDRLGTHKQLTDVHLAALAARRNGRLVTFDRGISTALHPDDGTVIELLPVT